jgi:hypothetical protein
MIYTSLLISFIVIVVLMGSFMLISKAFSDVEALHRQATILEVLTDALNEVSLRDSSEEVKVDMTLELTRVYLYTFASYSTEILSIRSNYIRRIVYS